VLLDGPRSRCGVGGHFHPGEWAYQQQSFSFSSFLPDPLFFLLVQLLHHYKAAFGPNWPQFYDNFPVELKTSLHNRFRL
jgi:hypothetical protein